MPDVKTVTINNTDYTLSPLRCKHLKKIQEVLAQGVKGKGVYAELERWVPFIGDSIRATTPSFQDSLLEELTLQEFTDTWQAIIGMSGIKLVGSTPAPDVSPAKQDDQPLLPIQ